MASRPARPAPLSQAPGALRRWPSLAGADCRPGGKIVSMCAESSTQGAAMSASPGRNPSALPLAIDLDVFQTRVRESGRRASGALALMKRRSGDLDQLGLPIHDAGFLQVEPLKGLVDGALAGEMNHAREGRRWSQIVHVEFLSVASRRRLNRNSAVCRTAQISGGYLTRTRKSPRAGAVGPAAPLGTVQRSLRESSQQPYCHDQLPERSRPDCAPCGEETRFRSRDRRVGRPRFVQLDSRTVADTILCEAARLHGCRRPDRWLRKK